MDVVTIAVAIIGSTALGSLITGMINKGRTAAETSEIESRVRQSLMKEIVELHLKVKELEDRLEECEKRHRIKGVVVA